MFQKRLTQGSVAFFCVTLLGLSTNVALDCSSPSEVKTMESVLTALTAFFMGSQPVDLAPKGPRPAVLEKATLGAGCFWGSEEFFRKVSGVYSTRVGYSGGSKPAGYDEVTTGTTGHAEVVEIEFDPRKINYEQVLTLFFKFHDPTTKDQQGNDMGSQYRSVIFYHSPDQEQNARRLMAKIEKSGAWKKPLTTEVLPAMTFYPAEEYHQKYLVKNPGGYDNHYLRNINFDTKKK